MPFQIMPSVKVAGPKGKAPVRDAPVLAGTFCEGCGSVECFERPASRLSPWRCYCDEMRANVVPAEVTAETCPKEGGGYGKVETRKMEKGGRHGGREGSGSRRQAGRAAAGHAKGAGAEVLDGTPYGATGEPQTYRAHRRHSAHYTTVTMDEPQGGKKRRTMSIARMMAQTWMPPQPPGTKLVHLDGDLSNNAASNLAWAPIDTEKRIRERQYAKALAEMVADPGDRRHGTKYGYTAGCRCPACTRAARVAKCMTRTRKAIKEVERACRAGTTP